MNGFHKPRFRDILFDFRRCGDIQKAMIDIAELSNEIWNEAIEAASKKVEDKFDFIGEELIVADEIRKLKK